MNLENYEKAARSETKKTKMAMNMEFNQTKH